MQALKNRYVSSVMVRNVCILCAGILMAQGAVKSPSCSSPHHTRTMPETQYEMWENS